MSVFYLGCDVPPPHVISKLLVYIQLTRYWNTLSSDVVQRMTEYHRTIFSRSAAALRSIYSDDSWCSSGCYILSLPIDNDMYFELLCYRSKYCSLRERHLLRKIRENSLLKQWATLLIDESFAQTGRIETSPWPEFILDEILAIFDSIESGSEQLPFGYFCSSSSSSSSSTHPDNTTLMISKWLYSDDSPPFDRAKYAKACTKPAGSTTYTPSPLTLTSDTWKRRRLTKTKKKEKKSKKTTTTTKKDAWVAQVDKILEQCDEIGRQVDIFRRGNVDARLLIRSERGQTRWKWEFLDKKSTEQDSRLRAMLSMARAKQGFVVTKLNETTRVQQHYLALTQ